MLLDATTPTKFINYSRVEDKNTVDVFRSLVRLLETLHASIATTVNANAIELVSQAAQPSATEGQFLFWVDTTGTPGTPKAHIVTLQGGVAYTFSSKEVY